PAPGFRRGDSRMSSAPSSGSRNRATAIPAAPALGLQLRAASCWPMAAASCSPIARKAVSGRWSDCPRRAKWVLLSLDFNRRIEVQPMRVSSLMGRWLLLVGLVAVLPMISGCNTLKGAGKDIQKIGEGVQTGVETVEDEVTK